MAPNMKDGGPAFPIGHGRDPMMPIGLTNPVQDGMTLRDWFAGQVTPMAWTMLDNMSRESAAKLIGVATEEYSWMDHSSMAIAALCYHFADAMLAAREPAKES